jgi:hypothetical protein
MFRLRGVTDGRPRRQRKSLADATSATGRGDLSLTQRSKSPIGKPRRAVVARPWLALRRPALDLIKTLKMRVSRGVTV